MEQRASDLGPSGQLWFMGAISRSISLSLAAWHIHLICPSMHCSLGIMFSLIAHVPASRQSGASPGGLHTECGSLPPTPPASPYLPPCIFRDGPWRRRKKTCCLLCHIHWALSTTVCEDLLLITKLQSEMHRLNPYYRAGRLPYPGTHQ